MPCLESVPKKLTNHIPTPPCRPPPAHVPRQKQGDLSLPHCANTAEQMSQPITPTASTWHPVYVPGETRDTQGKELVQADARNAPAGGHWRGQPATSFPRCLAAGVKAPPLAVLMRLGVGAGHRVSSCTFPSFQKISPHPFQSTSVP